MIVEVIAVGTELLLGQIVNTNAATIGRALADQGFDAHFQVVVGDNLEREALVIRQAMDRADAVIVTGGIGPTQDDLTREAICAATGRPMEFSEAYAAELRRRFEAWGREMPESNLRQAEYPAGAEMLPNPKGTAPGLALEHEGTWIFALPGVPAEMEHLLAAEVLPRLRKAAGITEVLVSRVVRTWGRTESWVADRLDDLYQASTNPSIAFLASGGEIKIRITAKAADETAAEALIAPVEAEIRRRLGAAVFGIDEDTIERVLLDLLVEKDWTVATAESATGGLVAVRVTSVPGSSKVFRGSVVAYASDLKQGLLGVPADVLAKGVVSEPVAEAMAAGVRRVLESDVGISVTGSAGPDPLEQQPGTMVVGISTPEATRARTLRLPGDRERVRTYTATAALHLARLAITGVWWGR